METYRILLLIDNEEKTEDWSGYTEQMAIAQCFLSHAQNGARKLEIISIESK